ncbi:hypothetical protein [Devosia sp.]
MTIDTRRYRRPERPLDPPRREHRDGELPRISQLALLMLLLYRP